MTFSRTVLAGWCQWWWEVRNWTSCIELSRAGGVSRENDKTNEMSVIIVIIVAADERFACIFVDGVVFIVWKMLIEFDQLCSQKKNQRFHQESRYLLKRQLKCKVLLSI